MNSNKPLLTSPGMREATQRYKDQQKILNYTASILNQTLNEVSLTKKSRCLVTSSLLATFRSKLGTDIRAPSTTKTTFHDSNKPTNKTYIAILEHILDNPSQSIANKMFVTDQGGHTISSEEFKTVVINLFKSKLSQDTNKDTETPL